MIIVNGCPKSGTHAVMAWLSQMGLKRCPGVLAPGNDGRLVVHGDNSLDINTLSVVPHNVFMQAHIPAGYDPDGSVITVFRDPRNVLVSYVRHQARWANRNLSLIQALDDFWGKRFVGTYGGYLSWQGRCVIVRYENLAPIHIGDGSDVYSSDRPAWDKWIGNTRTGAPSDWRRVWNDEVERAWQAHGGPELLRLAGYGDSNGKIPLSQCDYWADGEQSLRSAPSLHHGSREDRAA